MGIRVDPIGDPIGDDCLRCYEPGETPQILYATFRDIERGANWIPALPPPPNTVFQLIQSDVTPCLWGYTGVIWEVSYLASSWPPPPAVPVSSLHIGQVPFIPVFSSTADGECSGHFENEITEPPNMFYKGGAGWIFSLTI